ncbi:restriction endonuclease subunit S [Paraglaciecola sp.]|uniref:restriction endonuclease subunit S n=1 Tax=Paraglaciecola sp. TaxID=1920173 RepID=UPI0032665CB8
MSWPLVKIGEHLNVLSGFAFKSSMFSDKGMPLVRIRDVVRGRTTTYYSGDYSSEYIIRKGDLLVGMDGDFNRAYWESEDALLNQRVCKLTADNVGLDQGFLYHLLHKELLRIHRNTPAVTVKHLSVSKIKNIEIPLPPLTEQKRIAAILDKADAIRRKRQQAIQLADDFLRAVFLDMFGDPVTNPKGFNKVQITQLSDVMTGYAFKSEEYIPDSDSAVRLCRGANTLTGYFEWKDTVYWEASKLKGIENYKINAGDVILAMDRPWISSGLKVCIFPKNERDTYLVQRVARIRPKQTIYTDYLHACILSKAFEKHCCPTETTVPHISPVELKNFEVLLPKEILIKKYHDVVSKLRKSLSNMEAALVESTKSFNSLSQKAFAGEL